MRLYYLEEASYGSVADWIKDEHLESLLLKYFYIDLTPTERGHVVRGSNVSSEMKEYFADHNEETFDASADVTDDQQETPLRALYEACCDYDWFDVCEALAAPKIKKWEADAKSYGQPSYVGATVDAPDGYDAWITVQWIQQKPESKEEAVRVIADLTKVWKITAEDITEYLL